MHRTLRSRYRAFVHQGHPREYPYGPLLRVLPALVLASAAIALLRGT